MARREGRRVCCPDHGTRDAAFVCQHLPRGRGLGFHQGCSAEEPCYLKSRLLNWPRNTHVEQAQLVRRSIDYLRVQQDALQQDYHLNRHERVHAYRHMALVLGQRVDARGGPISGATGSGLRRGTPPSEARVRVLERSRGGWLGDGGGLGLPPEGEGSVSLAGWPPVHLPDHDRRQVGAVGQRAASLTRRAIVRSRRVRFSGANPRVLTTISVPSRARSRIVS